MRRRRRGWELGLRRTTRTKPGCGRAGVEETAVGKEALGVSGAGCGGGGASRMRAAAVVEEYDG
jgi:hypothetical protein